MKLHHIAMAAALAAAGSSSFAAGTYTFHLAGSSALQKVIAKSIANNCSALTTLSGVVGTPAAGPQDNANGQSQTLYQCTVVASGSSWGSTYNGATVNIYLNTQGSAYGVFPVAYNLAIPFIDPTSCTVTGTASTGPVGTCNNVVSVAPDAGVSDLEPAMFNDASNHPVDPTVGGQYPAGTQAPAGTVFPTLFGAYNAVKSSLFKTSAIAAVQTFGIAVNTNLYNDLQADQGLTGSQVPTISSSALATIYSPGYGKGLSNWSPLFSNGGGAITNQVNICSRLPGSGTRASAQALFLQAPFSSLSQGFATAAGDNTGADTTLSQTIGQNVPGKYEIGEYDNSGGVTGCLTAANTSGGYAIGLLSTDRAPSGYAFVNLDGSVPNASAAKYGKYQWVYEAWYQTNKQATTTNLAFANAFFNAFKTQANINALGAPSTNGVMAAVANCTAADYTVANSTCAHVSRGGKTPATLQFIQ